MTNQEKSDFSTAQTDIQFMNAGSPPVGGNGFSAWLGRSLLKLTGWKVESELPNYSKMVITIAPHTSNWDFFLGIAVLFSFRIRIRFLGKHTIFVPVAKQILEFLGGIPVKRSASHGVVEQIVNEFNTNEKMILAVAPEGTRSSVFPWKTGFLAIAHKAKVPVVMIGFDFKRKCVCLGPTITSEGNFEQEMQSVYTFYKTVAAKYPDKVTYPE